MKRSVIIICVLLFCACTKKEIAPTSTVVRINFTHNWDGTSVSNSDFNTIQYTNAFGTNLSIEKLRYLISNISFENQNGKKTIVKAYHLIDVSKEETMSFTTALEIPVGIYKNVSITFGFNITDNIDGEYIDLNSASWNVPGMLGGGYHFMQLEGKFTDATPTDIGYQYHVIRAVDRSGATPSFTETFIEKNLGELAVNPNAEIEIKMNIAEWFKNPTTWDLNTLHSMLMPNYNAQILMNGNGQNVFSLGSVNP